MLNNCFNDKDLINTQNFLDSATDEDLIKGISSIASASKTIGSFYEQAKMILRIHNAMMQRKNAVKECEKSWGSYCDQAFIYNQALTVRISYRRFKKNTVMFIMNAIINLLIKDSLIYAKTQAAVNIRKKSETCRKILSVAALSPKIQKMEFRNLPNQKYITTVSMKYQLFHKTIQTF